MPRLRLGVDATAVSHDGKGISRVQRHTVEALRHLGRHELTVFARHPEEIPPPTVHVSPTSTIFWEQVGLAQAPRRHRLDALLTWTERLPLLARGRYLVWLFEVPLRRIQQNRRSGVSRHDRASDLVTLAIWRRALARASVVFTGSRATADELVQLLPKLADRVQPLYPGLGPGFAPGDADTERPYVFHLASSDARDDTVTALTAFERARMRIGGGVRLVVAGGLGANRAAIEAAAGPAVELRGRVSDAELVELYQRASAYIDTSLYEGFGYQVLEAMACGTPVVATDATSIPEIVGNAALLGAPRDAEQLADALGRVLEDPALARELRTRGLDRAATFTWDRTAEAIAAAVDR